jgi:hypothetical protein
VVSGEWGAGGWNGSQASGTLTGLSGDVRSEGQKLVGVSNRFPLVEECGVLKGWGRVGMPGFFGGGVGVARAKAQATDFGGRVGMPGLRYGFGVGVGIAWATVLGRGVVDGRFDFPAAGVE